MKRDSKGKNNNFYGKKHTETSNSCHTKTNSNRKYWISFFQSLLSKKYGYEYSKNKEIIIRQINERFKYN